MKRAVPTVLVGLIWVIAIADAARCAEVAGQPPDAMEFLRREMQAQQIPGAQLAVVQDGRVVTVGAFGLASIEHSVPVTNDTIFAINSCTKAFVGVALMQLVDDGKLELNAPASRYLSDLPAAWREVTLRQMATNTSGLPEIWLEHRLIVDGNLEASWAMVKTLPMAFKPGERVQYNQTNWVMLQWIMEKASGLPLAEFVTKRQFDVVGMPLTARAGWADDYTIQKNKARVYTNVKNITKSDDWGQWPGQSFSVNTHKLRNNQPAEFMRATNAMAGLESNAQEIARWLIALQSGKLLTKESLKEMWTPPVLNSGEHGWWAVGWPVVERDAHPATKPSGGGRSAFAVYPDDGVAVVLLTNLLGAWPERFLDGIAAYYISDPEMHRARGFGLKPSLKVMHLELEEKGFTPENLEAAVRARAKDPSFAALEDLRQYALHLFWSAEYDRSLRVFELNARMHPTSVSAQEMLASAYQLNGDDDLAERTHRVVLDLKRKQKSNQARNP